MGKSCCQERNKWQPIKVNAPIRDFRIIRDKSLVASWEQMYSLTGHNERKLLPGEK